MTNTKKIMPILLKLVKYKTAITGNPQYSQDFAVREIRLINKYLSILFLGICILGISGCWSFNRPSKLQKAEELSRQKRYADAIVAYHEHMNERLAIRNRPEWENPYFYLILIGDIELGTDKPEDALNSYLEADQKEVDKYLVSDRIRSVARWYEEKNEYDKALQVLIKHREKDPLLFDAMLDRINKAKTAREDMKGSKSSSSS